VVFEAPTYDEAKAICVARGWSKPSIQSYAVRHRILEVARLAAADERVFEVHPEVSFREMLGRTLSRSEPGRVDHTRSPRGSRQLPARLAAHGRSWGCKVAARPALNLLRASRAPTG
jgi:predicted RNase H-like nuclease